MDLNSLSLRDLITSICIFLEPRDLLNLCVVCKTQNKLIKEKFADGLKNAIQLLELPAIIKECDFYADRLLDINCDESKICLRSVIKSNVIELTFAKMITCSDKQNKIIINIPRALASLDRVVLNRSLMSWDVRFLTDINVGIVIEIFGSKIQIYRSDGEILPKYMSPGYLRLTYTSRYLKKSET